MDKLLSWTIGKGGTLTKLEPQAGTRQLVTSEDVEAGDTLIAIPQELLLHADSAFEDAEYKDAFRQLASELRADSPTLDDRHLLCLLLVLEKARQGESAWEPYISILPEEYDDPYWWHDDQIQLLKGTRLSRAVATYHHGLQSITSSLQRLEQLYSASRPPGSAPSVLRSYRGGWALKLHAARWARSAVWSRSFTVRRMSNGARNVVAMVPLLDMIDHSQHMEVVWHTGQDGTEPFQFTPLSAVKKGSVMSNNYGRKSSDELLLAYGFLLEGPNPADYVVVSLAHSRGQQTAGSQQRDDGRNGAYPATAELGRAPMAVEAAGDGGDEDSQQLAAEDVQRALALAGLGLVVDQRLSAADPLPVPLLLGAQLCLLPVPQLYLWTARLQHAPGGLRLVNAPGIAEQYANSSATGHKRAWQSMQQGSDTASGGVLAPPSGISATISALLSADTAMHIEPAQQPPAAEGTLSHSQGSLPRISSGSQGEGHVPSPHLPVHLLHRLQALVCMKDQLQARLAGMASDEELHAAQAHALNGKPSPPHQASRSAPHATESPTLRGLAAALPSLSNNHTRNHNPARNGSPSSPDSKLPNGSPHHSHLAATYVGAQKSLVRLSLNCMARNVSSQVHAASELVQRTIDDQQVACKTLQDAAGIQPELQPSPQQQQGTGSTWSSIDPDLHVGQYVAWLRNHSLLPQPLQGGMPPPPPPPLEQGQQDGGQEPFQDDSMMQASPPPQQLQRQQAAAGGGVCVLQELVYRRCAPTTFASRHSSREGSHTSIPAPAPAAPAAPAPRPANGRRAPSASRTFTMKNATPGSVASAGGPQPSAASASASPVPAPQSPPIIKRVSLPQGIGASVGIDSDHDPIALGVCMTRRVEGGDVVARIPFSCCLAAPTKQQLVCTVMHSANRVLVALLAAMRPHMGEGPNGQPGEQAGANNNKGAAGMAAAQIALTAPCDMLVWHLMHCVAADASARLMSDVEGVQLLSEMLEDSPAGSAIQEAYDALKEQFARVRQAGVRDAAATSPPTKTDTLLRLLALPSSYLLFTWANHVVERCSMHATTADGKGLWVLAPVLSSMPAELRAALLVAEAVPGSAQGSCGGAAPAPDDAASPRAGTARGGSLVVHAACELQSGVHLSSLVLLPGQDMEDVMLCWGPEALPWQHLLHASIARRVAARGLSPAFERFVPAPQLATRHSTGSTSSSGCPSAGAGELLASAQQAADGNVVASRSCSATGVLLAAAVGLATRSVSTSALLAGAGFGPTVLYELYICPGERDANASKKLLMLAAAGLGCVHYLTEDFSTEHLVMSALKMCLAGPDLLKHPLMQRCLELHTAWQRGLRSPAAASSTAASQDAAPAPSKPLSDAKKLSDVLSPTDGDGSVVSAAGSPVAAGDAGQQGAAVTSGIAATGDVSGLDALAEAQVQLLTMLGQLPDDNPVCRAARKQLRQMVHDARKNTCRRLKQLEAVHNVVANHMNNSATASARGGGGTGQNGTYGVLGVLGGSYHSLGGSTAMHDGVRLYLGGVCQVLDTWADHLGLNRQSDSMNKRHKTRHEDI